MRTFSGPGQQERTTASQCGNVFAQFGVLQQVDDDREQAEHAAGRDQSAGVERAGTDFAFRVAFLLRAPRSASQRTSPPANIAIVVAMEMYEPTANGSERMPSSSTAITRNTPRSTSRHGRPLVQDAADHRGHQARLRRGGFVAADSLHPLNFDLAAWPDRRDIFRPELWLEPMALTRT